MKASDFFDSEEAFEELLELASRGARSPSEIDFVDSMIERQEEYGLSAFISDGQIEWLRKLANS